MAHANRELEHADRLAERIVELGGSPNFSPDTLSQRSYSSYDNAVDLKTMVRVNLVSELVAIESYTQMIALIGEKDFGTRCLLEEILIVERGYAEDLKGLLAGWLVE
jgi:bacterioferritin